jgi:hypothetical protein
VRADAASPRTQTFALRRSLSLNLLHGTLPASLSALRALTALSAAHNYLRGPLPAWSLPALRALDLSDNTLRSGGVPDTLLTLPRLALGQNLLDAADVSPALCGALCAGAGGAASFERAFACNASASPRRTCAALAPSADLSCGDSLCEPTCLAPLSVADWVAQAPAGAACAGSGLRRCSLCAAPVFTPLLDAAVASPALAADADALFACVQAHRDTMLAAGLNTLTVEAGTLCAALLPGAALGESVAEATAACRLSSSDVMRAFGPSLADARATQAACAPFTNGAAFDAAVCRSCAAAASAPFARAGVAEAHTMRSCVYDFAADLFGSSYAALFTLFACPDAALMTHTAAQAAAVLHSLPPRAAAQHSRREVDGAVGGTVGGAAVLAAALSALWRAQRIRRDNALRSAATKLLSVTTAKDGDGMWQRHGGDDDDRGGGGGGPDGSMLPALRGSLDGVAALRGR